MGMILHRHFEEPEKRKLAEAQKEKPEQEQPKAEKKTATRAKK